MSGNLNPNAVSKNAVLNSNLDMDDPVVQRLAEVVEMYPDGPSLADLVGWKKQFREISLFCPENGEEIYVLRPMSRLEHRRITSEALQLQNVSEVEVQELLAERSVLTCMLYPRLSGQDLVTYPAGLLPTLNIVVTDLSRFMSPDRAFSQTHRI